MSKRRFHEIFKNVNKQKLLAFSRIESYSLIRDFSQNYYNTTLSWLKQHEISINITERPKKIESKLMHTVGLKSQTGCHILCCKRPIWRVEVWPKWVGPAHSTLGQSIPYTSRLIYSKMNHFCPVVLKWHTFVFLSR